MSTITIDLVTPHDVLLEKTAIPNEYTVQKIVNEMVEHLDLPYFFEGQKVAYSLRWMNQDQVLDNNQTLPEAGVSAGDRLKLLSSIPLGGASGKEPVVPTDPVLPEPPKPSATTITVKFATIKNLKHIMTEQFELDVPIDNLIGMLVKRHQLPTTGEEGPITYYMFSKAQKVKLQGERTLRSFDIPSGDLIHLLKDSVAGSLMTKPKVSRRQNRLQDDYTDVMYLANQSDFIQVEPIGMQEGFAPEEYVVTYSCRGIARLDAQGNPVASDRHQVQVSLTAEYPRYEASLKWLTDIWHPNIDHAEPRHVCTNAPDSHYSQQPLAELVLMLGEMVQYKRYHAKFIKPFPQDPEVARWVREVAEPANIVGPSKPFDDRPLLRPMRIRPANASDAAPARATRIVFGARKTAPEPSVVAEGSASSSPAVPVNESEKRIVFGKPPQRQL